MAYEFKITNHMTSNFHTYQPAGRVRKGRHFIGILRVLTNFRSLLIEAERRETASFWLTSLEFEDKAKKKSIKLLLTL